MNKQVNNAVRATLLVAITLVLAACGGGNSAPPAVIPEITSIAISPLSGEMEYGSTKEFTVTFEGKGNFSREAAWNVRQCGSKLEATTNTLKVKAVDNNCPDGKMIVEVKSVADATKTATATISLKNQQPPTGNDLITQENVNAWITTNKVAPDTLTTVCGTKVPGNPDDGWKPFANSAERVLRAAVLEAPVKARMNAKTLELYVVTKPFAAVLQANPVITFNGTTCS